MIVLSTNLGDIEIELDKEKAPLTAANFETYVKEGFSPIIVLILNFQRGLLL